MIGLHLKDKGLLFLLLNSTIIFEGEDSLYMLLNYRSQFLKKKK